MPFWRTQKYTKPVDAPVLSIWALSWTPNVPAFANVMRDVLTIDVPLASCVVLNVIGYAVLMATAF
jgi:hypothetical protein